MEIQIQEARIILVIEAIRLLRKLNKRFTIKIYKVLYATLFYKMAGRIYRLEIRPNCQKLSELEEGVIIRYIFDLDFRGFTPRLAGVEDMANYIFESRRAKRIGKLWMHRFI